jgi:hypothetical protein
VRLAAADVVPVLGDIRQVREIAERANHQHGLFARKRPQQGIKRAAGLFIGVPFEGDAEAADLLDPLENLIAFLFADGRAENLSEQRMSSTRGASFEDSRFGNMVLGRSIIADADSTPCRVRLSSESNASGRSSTGQARIAGQTARARRRPGADCLAIPGVSLRCGKRGCVGVVIIRCCVVTHRAWRLVPGLPSVPDANMRWNKFW